jgi:hypothetical protein
MTDQADIQPPCRALTIVEHSFGERPPTRQRQTAHSGFVTQLLSHAIGAEQYRLKRRASAPAAAGAYQRSAGRCGSVISAAA